MQFKTISFMHMSHADFKGKGTKRSRHVLFFKLYSFSCFFFSGHRYFYTRLFSLLYFCYLIVHNLFFISLFMVSIEHLILNIQVFKAGNSFKHHLWHMVGCYEFFQAPRLYWKDVKDMYSSHFPWVSSENEALSQANVQSSRD